MVAQITGGVTCLGSNSKEDLGWSIVHVGARGYAYASPTGSVDIGGYSGEPVTAADNNAVRILNCRTENRHSWLRSRLFSDFPVPAEPCCWCNFETVTWAAITRFGTEGLISRQSGF